MQSPFANPARDGAQRAALLSLAATIGLVVVKLIAALASGSLALFSEAAHSGLDAGASALTFYAVRVASRPPDAEHPYGHGKAENLSAFVETLALFALAAVIAFEAVGRLTSGGGGQARAEWYTFAVMALSVGVDSTRSRSLRRAAKNFHSPALEADALHFTADLLTSSIVITGLVLLSFGIKAADPVGSLLVAAYVAYSSIRLGRRSIDVLMDRAPREDTARIERAAAGVDGVSEVRRVRIRYAGGQPQADVVIAISRSIPLERAHQVSEQVETAIKAKLAPGADVMVHIEPLADEILVAEQVRSLAARESQVSEVHNVVVTERPDGLHVSLHAKLPAAMSLEDAHRIVERLESEITNGISHISRVDTHIEPLDHPDEDIGTDVTSRQSTLVSWTKALAENQPEVLNCHEIVITNLDRGLAVVMHCEASPGLSVASVHEVSTRIEDEVHRRWSDVRRVTVHFEPGPA
ncbi:MAG: cation-efflux pump [Actinomycetota bacterium]|nr:cation-efflux pump [Actinomycetota bacterium]